jgi:hypothetical protein
MRIQAIERAFSSDFNAVEPRSKFFEPSALGFGEGLGVARLRNRGKAVFASHRFYDFHASVARIDLFAGSNHSRSF